MREKKSSLNDIRRELTLDITGIDNYKIGEPSLIVANHTCLKDIFTVPSALPEACQIVLSARLMWKRNTSENSLRRKTIEDALYGIPLEVHGGREKLQIGLEMAKRALLDGWSVIIFPEGAYIEDRQVNRGRNGAARILFGARQEGVKANLIPVSIDNQSIINNLDDFVPNNDAISVTIGKPIDYDEHYFTYANTRSPEDAKASLYAPIDIAMRSIAKTIKQPYVNKHIELRPRNTIVLESGEEISL
jgi:1-acyl-sn-glycerol-3-phosphate acyltransferase